MTGAVTRITCQSSEKPRTSRQADSVELGDEERREPPDLFLRDRSRAGRRRQTRSRRRRAAPPTRRRRAAAGRRPAPTSAPAYGPAIRPGEKRARERQVGRVVVEQQPRTTTPATSGTPRPAANTSRSGQSRRSVSRMRRNQRNRTSIVASVGRDGQLDDERRQQELLGGQRRGPRCASRPDCNYSRLPAGVQRVPAMV